MKDGGGEPLFYPPMVFLTFVLLWPVLVLALYRHLETRPDDATMWRHAVTIGLLIGIVRGVLASAGWYAVEHTGGPLQTPAFALAMLAWPEAVMLGSRRGVTPLGFYPVLALLLTVSSLFFVSAVAFVVQATRRG